jgi:hypothetical protein
MNNSCEIRPRPKSIKEFFTTWYFWRPFMATTIGLLAGFLYYYFFECNTIPCIITNNAWSSVLFGGFAGFWITSSPCSRFGR